MWVFYTKINEISGGSALKRWPKPRKKGGWSFFLTNGRRKTASIFLFLRSNWILTQVFKVTLTPFPCCIALLLFFRWLRDFCSSRAFFPLQITPLAYIILWRMRWAVWKNRELCCSSAATSCIDEEWNCTKKKDFGLVGMQAEQSFIMQLRICRQAESLSSMDIS